MTGLAEWLLDQISDDEKSTEHALWSEPDPWRLGNYCEYGHITIDPRRVLAECAAKRAIIDLADEATGLDYQVDSEFRVSSDPKRTEPYCGDKILRALAAPYSDRPGFREEWRV